MGTQPCKGASCRPARLPPLMSEVFIAYGMTETSPVSTQTLSHPPLSGTDAVADPHTAWRCHVATRGAPKPPGTRRRPCRGRIVLRTPQTRSRTSPRCNVGRPMHSGGTGALRNREPFDEPGTGRPSDAARPAFSLAGAAVVAA
jgi:acyl-CoA synthetase (AMP-forming)/AMP-acid ligase II